MDGLNNEAARGRAVDLQADEKQALAELKGAVMGMCGDKIVKFVLYGSRARGDYDRDSDVDIAIVVRGLTGELKRRIIDAVCEIEFKYSTYLSTLVLSEEDFNFLKARERRIALDIEREGIPL